MISEIKMAVDLVNAERTDIDNAVKLGSPDALLLATAFNLYVIDKDAYRAGELIQAAYNWLAATGRAEGGEVLK